MKFQIKRKVKFKSCKVAIQKPSIYTQMPHLLIIYILKSEKKRAVCTSSAIRKNYRTYEFPINMFQRYL